MRRCIVAAAAAAEVDSEMYEVCGWSGMLSGLYRYRLGLGLHLTN